MPLHFWSRNVVDARFFSSKIGAQKARNVNSIGTKCDIDREPIDVANVKIVAVYLRNDG